MDKYRILRRHEGYVTIQSEKGKIVRINESSFRENFVKLKDAIISYARKGKEIFAKISGKIVEGVNSIYNVILNKEDGTYLYVAKSSKSTCDELGIENPNSEFDEYLKNVNIEDAAHAEDMLADVITGLIKRSLGEKERGVFESRDAVKGAYDEYPRMRGSRIQNSKGEIDPKLFRTPEDGTTGYQPLTLRSQIEGVDDYTREELMTEIDDQLSYIFGREITEDSCKKFDKGLYKPYLVFGAAGIGKSTIIEQLRDKYSEELGVNIQWVPLNGQNIGKYSFTSPSMGKSETYVLDDKGRVVKDSEGNPIPVENRQAIEDVMSANFVALNYEEGVMHNNVKERDEACGYGIIFIDEISRIPEPNILNAIMGFCYDRHVGPNYLGTHWAVIAATNPGQMTAKGKKGFTEADIMNDLFQDAAKARRFNFVNFCPTLDEWLEWARGAGVNEFVINFLSDPKFMFHFHNAFDYVTLNNLGKVSSPAAWEELSSHISNLIRIFERRGKDIRNIKDAKEFIERVRSKVGQLMPNEKIDFTEYMKDELVNVSKEDFVNAWIDPKKIVTKVPEDPKDPDSPLKTVRSRNSHFGTNGSGLSTSIDRFAHKLYEECPIKIENESDGVKFMNNMEKYFDNVSEFIDYFYSDGTQLASVPAGSGLDTHPYNTDGFFKVTKKSVIKNLAELFRQDLNKAFNSNETLTSIFINGLCDGKRYPVSKYFKYLLNWAFK